MELWQVIVLIVVCGFMSFIMYGIWTIENDRYEFRMKHGYDPYRYGWETEDEKVINNDETQDK